MSLSDRLCRRPSRFNQIKLPLERPSRPVRPAILLRSAVPTPVARRVATAMLLAIVAVLALVPNERPSAVADEREQETAALKKWLAQELLVPGQTQEDVCVLTERRTPVLSIPADLDSWRTKAEELRVKTLETVVFRGVPKSWREGPPQVIWGDDLEGGPGYRMRKLRYEALPGLWIPAVLYVPEKKVGRVPVGLAVNGHDPLGKAAKYKQLRCINQAKRGMLVLNVEWLGMGQLRSNNFAHGRMNQLELVGVAGLAPFYLAMQRGLDVLLAQEGADRTRVAVSGLSGGGWQTIFISALDPRVTLSNPVAGYSSFITRARHHSDLGDSEQTPTDMATVVDYTHLTALRAPRPTLLTYNVKDDCCFASAHALPPLLAAATPAYRMFGAESALTQHVNHDPGTHNFERDNREAFYRLLSANFSSTDSPWPTTEIESEAELKTVEQLNVPLPADNADFHSLALAAAKAQPRDAGPPSLVDLQGAAAEKAAAEWRRGFRERLQPVVRIPQLAVMAQQLDQSEQAGIRATLWRLRLGETWTLPVIEFTKLAKAGATDATPARTPTTLMVSDSGRASLADDIRGELAAGRNVVVVDLFSWGECTMKNRGYLFSLLVATVGERPLGVQAGQLQAVAKWLAAERRAAELELVARGPRASLAALVAAASDDGPVAGLRLVGSHGSLHEVLEQNLSVDQAPELFCFGLLNATDILQLAAAVAPRPVRFVEPSARAKQELAALKTWYSKLGKSFDPLAVQP